MSEKASENQLREIKKRPRPVLSCLQCRQKKLKCDRLLPCQQCIKGGRTQQCEYAEGQEPEIRQEATDCDSNKRVRLSSNAASSSSLTTSGPVDEVLDRLKSLEKTLQSQQESFHKNANFGPHRPHPAIPNEEISDDLKHEFLEGWKGEKCSMNSFHLTSRFIQSLPLHYDDAELIDIAYQARTIQQSLQRPGRQPRAPYSESQGCLKHMLQILPGRDICEKLVDLYFENFEHCARILYKPTFVKLYRDSVADLLPDDDLQGFIPLLVGVLLAASSLNTLEECDLPALHGGQDGIGAMQLLHNWIDLQVDDARYTTSTLQTRLLLLLSMKLKGYDNRVLWNSSGQLVRDAMIMKLHDTVPKDADILSEEIRRRLWFTVVEWDLAHAICLGMPANIPKLEEGCIPLNISDGDLSDLSTRQGQSKPTTEWTDGLCQHILGQSFNARLDAYNYSFRKQPLNYGEILVMAKELEHVVYNLPPTFKLDQNHPPGRLVAQMEVDISLRRPLVALYTPFALAMPVDDRYRDARIGWVQANLVILCFQDLFDPKFPAIEVPRPEGYWDLYYTVYMVDVLRALHAQSLEFQRMRDPLQSHLNGLNLGLQQHSHRSGSRALGWTVKGMEESIEDTLDPLIRRVGRQGAALDVVLRYQLVYDSLRCEDQQNVDNSMRSGLKLTLSAIRTRLERQGHRMGYQPIDVDSGVHAAQEDLHWFARFLNGEDLERK